MHMYIYIYIGTHALFLVCGPQKLVPRGKRLYGHTLLARLPSDPDGC